MTFTTVYQLFLPASWLCNFILHTAIVYPTLISLMVHRYVVGDKNNIPIGIGIAIAGFSLLSTSVYLNIRAKAQLYFKLKVI